MAIVNSRAALSPVPAAAAPAVLPPRSSQLPFYVAVALLFTHFARPFDTVLVGYKIPAIICTIGILVAFLAGGLKELRSSVGIAFLLLVGWMCVSAPFSTWKGGTFMYVLWYAQFFLPLMLLIAVASKTPNDIVKICGVLAFSCCCHLILNGASDAGRYSLKGTFGNPDDVALLAGFTIPFWVLIATRLRNPILRYCLLLGGCTYLLHLTGATATRAAIPALIAMLAVYFFRSRGGQKVAVLAFAGIGAMFVVLTLPGAAITRLSTVLEAFNPPQVHPGMSEADASSLERHEIMRDAIVTTIHHPIVGVGAGMFTQYRWDMLPGSNGQHKPYLPTHNTYLQISSECGIPGVIVYLIFLGAIYRQTRVMQKLTLARATPQSDLMWSIAVCAEAALVYFAVCAAFMTCDRHPHQFVLAGIAIALQRIGSSMRAEAPMVASPVRFPLPQVPVVKRPYPAGMR